MPQRSRGLAVLADDLNLVPSTNMEAHSFPVPGGPAPSSTSAGIRHVYSTDKHAHKTLIKTNLTKVCMMCASFACKSRDKCLGAHVEITTARGYLPFALEQSLPRSCGHQVSKSTNS